MEGTRLPIVADEYTHVISVDTHARTHTYAVVETRTGKIVDSRTFPTSQGGLRRALGWIRHRVRDGHALAAVEGTNSYGARRWPHSRRKRSWWPKPGRHGELLVPARVSQTRSMQKRQRAAYLAKTPQG